MNVGKKLSLTYTFVTVSVMVIVATTFYVIMIYSSRRFFYDSMEERAYLTAQRLWSRPDIDDHGYIQTIEDYADVVPVETELILPADSIAVVRDKLSVYLSEVEFDTLLGGNAVRFSHGRQLGVAISYRSTDTVSVIVELSDNAYGLELREQMFWIFLIFLVVLMLFMYFINNAYVLRIVGQIEMAYHREKAFISHASHELNNPLTAVQGECEITLLRERSASEYQASLLRIEQETQRIIQMLKQLLLLAQGDKELLDDVRDEIDLLQLLSAFTDHRIQFSSTVLTQTAMVSANEPLLKIAIQNVVNNALKYSDDKPVKITLSDAKEHWSLVIRDYGIGIPAEERNLVFQPFFRASNTRSYAGQGVGLSLSERIFSVYGIHVEIRSAHGEGTEFALLIPKLRKKAQL